MKNKPKNFSVGSLTLNTNPDIKGLGNLHKAFRV